MSNYQFDDKNINWRKLGDFENFTYTVFDVDLENEIADFSLKFDPNEKIFLHRHRALTNTFVVSGEHRIYEPDGSLRETRPVGSFTASPASLDPHSEGGGEKGAVINYTTRGSTDGIVFDVLDDKQELVGTLSISDLAGLFELQGRRPGA
ncbi:MAG: regulator [Pseudomonadota bacterium]